MSNPYFVCPYCMTDKKIELLAKRKPRLMCKTCFEIRRARA